MWRPLGGTFARTWPPAADLKASNRSLRRTGAQFSAIFDHAPSGMALVAFDGTVIRANPALSTLLGLPPGRLLGRVLHDLVVDNASHERLFAELVAGRSDSYDCEQRVLVEQREPRWVRFSVARVLEMDGEDYAAFHVEDITDRKDYERELQYLADHDPLTGLLNRSGFRAELDAFLSPIDRRRRQGVLTILGLDEFKYVNDTLSHSTGDALLQSVATAVAARLRSGDRFARLGGDEFAILLDGVSALDAPSVVDGILLAVREQGSGRTDHPPRTTASAGLVILDPDDQRTSNQILANADLAMYEAKENGRDRLVMYDEASPFVGGSAEQLRWIDRIRDALQHNLFELLAQPILDLHTNTVNGCELLLRMRRDGVLVPPAEFLAIAEQHGFAGAIDNRVLELGIALAGRTPRGPGFRWEINLSGAALADPEVPELIARLLAEHDVPAASIVFEITESLAIINKAQAQAFATRIADLGCGFALDDFGAGYGSFYYLKFLPLDYLKIDGEVIRDLTSDRTNQIIVQAMVAAARQLGMETIAEYVGDEATVALLREYGVDHAQGYYVGVPTDPATISRPA